MADLQHTPADRDGPLEGLKVLDLTEHMAVFFTEQRISAGRR